MMRWAAIACGALALGLAIAVLATQLMLEPPRQDLIDLSLYLLLSGAASLTAGVLIVTVLERSGRLSFAARAVVVALVTSGVFVTNIVVLARMMFISTDHDLQVLLAATAFGAIVASAFAAWAASMTSRRVIRVNDGIRALATGRRDLTLEADGRDEIGALAGDVLILASRLRDAESERAALDAERRELTAAISHDLRTPLSTIRAMVDALEEGVVSDPVETRRYLVTIRRDVERLNRMIDDLFELAQIDSGALSLRRATIAIDEIVSEAAEAMRARADRAGVRLTIRIEGATPRVLADGDRIERAVANLLRNALEHTPAGGEIAIEIRPTTEHVSIAVADTGDGIDGHDLPHIWTRFYRADRSRSRARTTDDGVGLGLAIAKGIIELHGGHVEARSEPGRGSTFELVLPLASEGKVGGV